MNKDDGVRLNDDQIHDVYEMYHSVPYITVSRNAFVNMVLDCPPQVKLKKHKQVEQTLFMSDIMEEYYLPFTHQVYDWIKVFGLYPWYPEKITGTEFSVPVIPPMDSGYITTHLNAKHKQVFKWFWNDTKTTTGHDRRVKFRFKSMYGKPDIHGNLRSGIKSALAGYKTMKIVRESTEIGSYHSVRPQHVFEYKPPRNAPGDDNLTTLDSFGEDIAGIVQQQQEGLRIKKQNIRTDALRYSVMKSIEMNTGVQMKFGSQPILRSETGNTEWERRNASLLDKAIPLQADYVYKAAATPKVAVDLIKISNHFETMLTAIMDFPREMIEAPSGNKKASAGTKTFLIGRVNDWNNFLQKELKHVFIQLHRKQLEAGFEVVAKNRRKKNNYTPIHIDDEVEILMPCSSIATHEDLKEVYMDGLMDQKTFAKHTFMLLGLPQDEITLSEPPLTEAPPKQKKQKVKESVF